MMSGGSSKESCNALEKFSQHIEEFKKPQSSAPRTRKKKAVLDEATYIKKISKIIERDFFPDLENLKDKLEYIEAKESNNICKLREIYTKYSSGKTPNIQNVEDSPATFETPEHQSYVDTFHTPDSTNDNINGRNSKNNSSNPEPAKIDVEKKLPTLDKFMNSNTSEDNQSFEQLMEETRNKFKMKRPWMFEAEEKHNNEHAPNMKLPSVEQQAEVKRLALTGIFDLNKDTRPKQIENWSYTTFNSIMYVPEGNSPSKEQLMEQAKLKPREVIHPNTRFVSNPFTETVSQATMMEACAIQASKKEGKVGIDGKELNKETPRVNGYTFVHTPSPAPGVDASPLMTWGHVDGTPFQLDGSHTPLMHLRNPTGPSYRIPQVPEKDRLAQKLAEKVSQNHKEKKTRALHAAKCCLVTPNHKFGKQSSIERLSSMSPAAQKLFASRLRIQGSDSALRASYTPFSSARKLGSTPDVITPKSLLLSSRKSINTPNSIPYDHVPHSSSKPANLTDNLLELPKRNNKPENDRCSAADFF